MAGAAPRRRALRSPPKRPLSFRRPYPPRMGRFASPQDPLFQRLNSSVSFDYRLAPYDLELSGAHARMLASREIITTEDLEAIERGLAAIRAEIDADSFRIEPSDEDIHMAIERRLIE